MSEFFERILDRLAERFGPETLGASVGGLAANVLTAALTFAVFYGLWRFVDFVLRPVLTRAGLDRTAVAFAESAAKYGLLALGLVAAAAELGVHTAPILASLGVLGLTLGFAARDTLSNVISGLFIFWDRPFVIDDLIEVGEHYGRVDRITLRSTRVVTADGRMLAIPNADMVNKTVASYTNFPHLRIDVPFSIDVGEDVDRARYLALRLVRSNPAFVDDPPPRVLVTELGDYKNTLQLQAWLDNERTHVGARSDLRESLFETLRSAGVEMPYETIRLTPLEVRSAAAESRAAT